MLGKPRAFLIVDHNSRHETWLILSFQYIPLMSRQLPDHRHDDSSLDARRVLAGLLENLDFIWLPKFRWNFMKDRLIKVTIRKRIYSVRFLGLEVDFCCSPTH